MTSDLKKVGDSISHRQHHPSAPGLKCTNILEDYAENEFRGFLFLNLTSLASGIALISRPSYILALIWAASEPPERPSYNAFTEQLPKPNRGVKKTTCLQIMHWGINRLWLWHKGVSTDFFFDNLRLICSDDCWASEPTTHRCTNFETVLTQLWSSVSKASLSQLKHLLSSVMGFRPLVKFTVTFSVFK